MEKVWRFGAAARVGIVVGALLLHRIEGNYPLPFALLQKQQCNVFSGHVYCTEANA
jgi:hypothetical protein